MKQVLKAFLGFTAALLLAGCNNLIQIDEVGTTTTTSSSSSGGVTYALNSDGTVTLNFSSLYGSSSSSVSRSISPSTPELYWTVYGSTTKDSSNDADYTSTDGDLSTVWYGPKDTTSGVSFTIGAVNNRVWYFTAIATREAQSSIYGTAETDADKVTALKAKAIAKGTIAFKMTINQGDGTVALAVEGTSSTAGSKIEDSVITIGAVDTATSDSLGYAIIPVSIPATTSLARTYYQIDTVTLNLTKGADTITYKVTDIAGAALDFAFTPTLAAGTYSVELLFQHEADSDKNTDDNVAYEVYSHYDTLTVKGNYTSYVVSGTSALTGDVSFTTVTNTDTTAATAAGSVSASSLVASSGLTIYDGSTKVGYVLQATAIPSYRRSTFYVAGDGVNLTVSATKKTGSKVLPFATITEALANIPQLADGTGTTTDTTNTKWTIIVDGTTEENVSLSNERTDKDATVLIKAYGDSATIAGTLSVTSSNKESAGKLSFILENMTVTGAVTVGTPYFYLHNSVLSGAVTLNKETSDGTYDGTLNADVSDSTSKALNITLQGTSGSPVVRRCTFGTDGFPATYWNGTSSDVADSVKFNEAVYKETLSTETDNVSSSAQYRLSDDYIKDKYDATTKLYYRYLRVATDAETSGNTINVGDLMVKYNSAAASISYDNTSVTHSVSLPGGDSWTVGGNAATVEITLSGANNTKLASTALGDPTYYLYLKSDGITGDVLNGTESAFSLVTASYDASSGKRTIVFSSLQQVSGFNSGDKVVLEIRFTAGSDNVDISYEFTYTTAS